MRTADWEGVRTELRAWKEEEEGGRLKMKWLNGIDTRTAGVRVNGVGVKWRLRTPVADHRNSWDDKEEEVHVGPAATNETVKRVTLTRLYREIDDKLIKRLKYEKIFVYNTTACTNDRTY